MDHLKQGTLDEVVALMRHFPDAPSFLLALAQWGREDSDCRVVTRRFGTSPLSGRDLKTMRTGLLSYTQDQVAERFGISRNSVSRIEGFTHENLDRKASYAYLGLLFTDYVVARMLMEQERSE